MADKSLITSVYECLFTEIWDKVSRIIGGIALELAIRASIKKLLPVYKFLEYIEISQNGISFDKLRGSLKNFSENDLKKGLQLLVNELTGIFAVMCGDVLLKEIIPCLKKAKRKINSMK